ncbi:winged helix-turn-helix transcriptional regulator [Novosphingobium album (ex Liu et al. 2023)]|uniref:Helix-turn-helix domain-containing protein n=1 Tax=Novosphingobium album (ex Liu et al. 2023) TaxID=3031130 RepID=A0ABT5WLD9_9SPHN|nr:helix-turn-helix domain-containing protein [Novosphingobium album (ex Liu et al. 2023)]MDE8650858.1 helix-turn-helix domain-containing protein [Novosphingobium album (ex Liu et al. 2023)]
MTVPSRPAPAHEPGECRQLAGMLSRIGDRWTLPVVVSLREEALRFNQLRRVVGGISQQMLTRTLRALERDGMVRRTVHPTVPPQVEYALTTLGISLAAEALRIGSWIQAHRDEIDAHRQRYDDAAAG